MKLTRKSIGRIAASFVATAMLATMAIVPASAEGSEPTVDDSYTYATGSTFTIAKNLSVPANVLTPDTTITFSVAVAQPSTNQQIGNIVVESGVEGAVTMTSGADFDTETNVTGTNADRTVTKNATFNVDISKFNHAGIYKYTVSEVNGGYEGLTYTTVSKDLYVFIQNDPNATNANKLKVAYTMLTATNDATDKDNSFDNKYGKDNGGKDTIYDLSLTKQITGNAADMRDEFKFTITVTGNVEGEKYILQNGAEYEIITSGTPVEVNLGDDESVTIYGLSANDKYTIVEDYGDKVGYTTTATVNNSSYDLNNGLTVTTNQDTTITSDQTVVYTNDKGSSAPTGIMMDIAPYAVLVVIAAAGCFIFLRKRHAKED